MNLTEELEIWSVWLGNDAISERVETQMCRIDELTAEKLKNFFENKKDYKCILVKK